MHTPKNHPYLSSYGRNRGRSLSPHQQGLVENLLPKLAITLDPLVIPMVSTSSTLFSARSPLAGERMKRGGADAESWGGGATHSAAELAAPPPHASPAALPLPREGGAGIGQEAALKNAATFSKLALEIGFGGGEHLVAQAAHHPEVIYIGCEPYLNGVAKCLVGIEEQNLTNIRLYTHDARELIAALPDACLDTVFILFPDPWPKLRHTKRRLVNAQTLSMLARIHKPGGRLLIATDHVDYSVWILEVLLAHPDYRWTAEKSADWLTPPKDWTETKYQRKTSAEGRVPQFFECVRC